MRNFKSFRVKDIFTIWLSQNGSLSETRTIRHAFWFISCATVWMTAAIRDLFSSTLAGVGERTTLFSTYPHRKTMTGGKIGSSRGDEKRCHGLPGDQFIVEGNFSSSSSGRISANGVAVHHAVILSHWLLLLLEGTPISQQFQVLF